METPEKSPLLFPNHSIHCLVAASGSGKTHYCLSILKNIEFFYKEKPNHIIYVYEVWQDIYNTISGVEFIHHLPSIEKITSYNQDDFKCLILDDQCQEVSNSKEYSEFMCISCHHHNYTVFYLKQSLFDRVGKYSRLINLQTHYFHIFECKRDIGVISNLGRQILPGQSSFFMDAYKRATSIKYQPLLIDLHPHTETEYMLRSDIFNPFPTVYKKI